VPDTARSHPNLHTQVTTTHTHDHNGIKKPINILAPSYIMKAKGALWNRVVGIMTRKREKEKQSFWTNTSRPRLAVPANPFFLLFYSFFWPNAFSVLFFFVFFFFRNLDRATTGRLLTFLSLFTSSGWLFRITWIWRFETAGAGLVWICAFDPEMGRPAGMAWIGWGDGR
jgi:hypothetical protein